MKTFSRNSTSRSGSRKGVSISVAGPSTDAVGVDPMPQIARRLPPNISIFAETSDAFFAAYETRAQFAKRKIDMAFIDGLHLFEQALRDFINVEKRAAADGLIALHDCIPFDDVAAGRDFHAPYWVGDVWKCLAILMDHRPDLHIEIVGAPPSGLVLVRRLDPDSRLLDNKFEFTRPRLWAAALCRLGNQLCEASKINSKPCRDGRSDLHKGGQSRIHGQHLTISG